MSTQKNIWWVQNYITNMSSFKFGQIDVASKDCYRQKVGIWHIYDQFKQVGGHEIKCRAMMEKTCDIS